MLDHVPVSYTHLDVYKRQSLYLSFGASGREEALLQRALRLLEDARLLIQQNRDPKINQDILFGKMAEARLDVYKRQW